jgi:plastocyanin
MTRAGCALALLAALGPELDAAPTEHTIVIDGLRFIPQTVEVKRGDTVVWRNKDPFPHTATAETTKGGPASPVIAAGASWRFKAGKAGTYPYLCTLHRTMTATLVVK